MQLQNTGSQNSVPARLDVAIAGAGIAGSALALALAQSLGSGFRVAVFDPALRSEPRTDDRVVALAAGARQLLEALGVWQALGEVQPIRTMTITDSRLEDAVRQPFLDFGPGADGIAYAHMAENRLLAIALRAAARAEHVKLVPDGIESFSAEASGVRFQGGDKHYRARLLVAADGAQSKLRSQAGIRTVAHGYAQSGIVATIGHEREHEGRAVQHFLPGGSFAILPLTGKRSSIVWTESTAEAERIVALAEAEFLTELETRFGLQLGELTVLSRPRAYPLHISIARRFVAERFALIGDAAHVIHPLAGQGLNLGLRDVAALAECIADDARLGLDPGAAEPLSRYECWRRADTVAMGLATDGLNRLFSNESTALRYLRDLGLGLLERTPALKELFASEAAGLTGDVPKLLRGELI